MSKLNDLELMLLADGEHDAGAAARDAVPTTDDRAKIEAIREVGQLVRTHLELAADDAEDRLAGLWDLVERRLDAEERADAIAVPRAAAPARAAAPGLWARFVGWVGGHRSQLLTGFVAAGAAAAITVVARPAHQRTVYVPTTVASNGNGGGTGVGVGSGPGTGTGSAGAVLVSAKSTPTEVESLDVPDGTGSVFTIDDDDGETTVIWVTPDDVVEGL